MPELPVTAAPPTTDLDETTLEFPGCRPVPISHADIERCERRI